MQEVGKALKVSIHIADGATDHGATTPSSLLDFLFYRGVSGATVLKGIAGFGADHQMHAGSFGAGSDHLPVKIEFIESHAKVEELMPRLKDLCGAGIIEVQETTIAKAAGASSPHGDPAVVGQKTEHQAKLLRSDSLPESR
jgi:hypothetical protein